MLVHGVTLFFYDPIHPDVAEKLVVSRDNRLVSLEYSQTPAAPSLSTAFYLTNVLLCALSSTGLELFNIVFSFTSLSLLLLLLSRLVDVVMVISLSISPKFKLLANQPNLVYLPTIQVEYIQVTCPVCDLHLFALSFLPRILTPYIYQLSWHPLAAKNECCTRRLVAIFRSDWYRFVCLTLSGSKSVPLFVTPPITFFDTLHFFRYSPRADLWRPKCLLYCSCVSSLFLTRTLFVINGFVLFEFRVVTDRSWPTTSLALITYTICALMLSLPVTHWQPHSLMPLGIGLLFNLFNLQNFAIFHLIYFFIFLFFWKFLLLVSEYYYSSCFIGRIVSSLYIISDNLIILCPILA